jgi:putative transposase
MADLIKELRRLCDQQNLKAPNYWTIRKRVQALDAKLALQRRHGSKIANAKYQPVGISPFSALAPLQLFQIDHTPVDVIVVDEQDRLPVGRPWLTLVIDVGSRVVAGFCVSLDDPSTLSVARALTHAVTPKDKWLSERGVEVEWPVAGIPKALHLDNAKEFESAALVRGCQEYGIELEYRPPGRPHFGGHVERLIGTMMGAVHLLPGTTFSNVAQKGNYKSESAASLTLAELERWLAFHGKGLLLLLTSCRWLLDPWEGACVFLVVAGGRGKLHQLRGTSRCAFLSKTVGSLSGANASTRISTRLCSWRWVISAVRRRN